MSYYSSVYQKPNNRKVYKFTFKYGRGRFYGKKVVPISDFLEPMELVIEAVSEKQARFLLYRHLDERKGSKAHVLRDLTVEEGDHQGLSSRVSNQ